MDILSSFFHMKVYCVFSLESPQQGDSNEYTQYTIFNIKKKNHFKLSRICSYLIVSEGLKNEFESAVVNEPSVFEPSKFYCMKIAKIDKERVWCLQTQDCRRIGDVNEIRPCLSQNTVLQRTMSRISIMQTNIFLSHFIHQRIF